MASIVGGIYHGAFVFLTGKKLVSEIRTAVETRDPFKVCPVVLSGVAFAANIAAIGANVLGKSSDTLASIKGIEFAANLFKFPMSAAESDKGIIEMVCQVVTVLRSGSEYFKYLNQYYLSLPPEDFAKLKVAIYDNPYSEDPIKIGERSMTLDECIKIIAKCKKDLPKLKLVELVTQTSHAAFGKLQKCFDKVLESWV